MILFSLNNGSSWIYLWTVWLKIQVILVQEKGKKTIGNFVCIEPQDNLVQMVLLMTRF